MARKIIAIMKLIIAVALLLFLFRLANFDKFLEHVKHVTLWPLVVVVLLYFIGIYVSVVRWDCILRFYKLNNPHTRLFKGYLIGGFFNNFLPTSIGGDVYRYLFMKEKHPFSSQEVFCSLFVERGVGFLTLFIVNIILAAIYLNTIISHRSFLIVEGVMIAAFIAILCTVLFRARIFSWMTNRKNNFFITRKINEYLEYLMKINNMRIIAVPFLYSLLFIFISSLIYYLVFSALNCNVKFSFMILTCTIIGVFRAIPISFNSIGVSEGLFVFLFATQGQDPSISLSGAIITRTLIALASVAGGCLFFLKEIKTFKKGNIDKKEKT